MRSRLFHVLLAGMLAALVAAAIAPSAPTRAASDPPTSTGTGGAAASVERLASQAAIDILAKGGNAIDAAVAASAVLGVTEPFSCGGFMIFYQANQRHPAHPHVFTLDFREKATGAMNATSFWENGRALAFNDARYSGMSVGVPGTVDAWATALKRWGTISLAKALAPAIRVAQNGFQVDQPFFSQTQENLDYFDDVPAAASLYLDPDGTPHDVGTTFRNPDLAKTYGLLATGGAPAFYGGALANAIVQTVTHPQIAATANHTWRPGLMTTADLDAYEVKQRPPTRVSYRG